ncbi:MAG: hypothetical protein AAFN80_07210 [Pseudomonadota bacterium]
MLAAKQVCENRNLAFQDVFSRQYCLSKRSLPQIEGWESPKPLLGWRLTHCAKLCRCDLLDKCGEHIGWFLGSAVDQNGNFLGKSEVNLTAALSDPDFWSIAEKEISDLAGRYLVFVITDKGQRAYFDPVTDLPAVFNRMEQTVASSPLMALSSPIRANHRINHNQVLKKGGNYGVQQTCDPDVLRVLSNHYLDLETFSLHRHWPSDHESFEAPEDSLDAIAQKMVARLGQVTSALLNNRTCMIALSGGMDSRTLVYSAKEDLHLAKLTYSHRATWISQYDCYIGQLVATELGLAKNFQIFDALKQIKEGIYDNADLRRLRWEFCYRTGYQNAPKNAVLVVADILPDTDYVLRGNILDMARANQWPRGFKFDLNHGISKLVLGGRTAEENLAYWGPEYLNWMDTLPKSAQPRIYDLAFVEQLLPNTLGGRLIGYGNANYINPFNDRYLIHSCMQIDPAKRKSGLLNSALHRACSATDLPMTRSAMSDDKTKAEVEKLFA